MQGSSPSWFHGLTSHWWDLPVTRRRLLFGYDPIYEEKNSKVIQKKKINSNFGKRKKWTFSCFCRYGLIFKTSVAGRPIIVSADPNFNHYIFQQDGKLFDQWSLDSLPNLLGKAGAGINVAHIHKYVRSMFLNHFGVNALEEKLLLQMEEMVSVALDNWSCQASIDVKYASTTVST